MKILKSLWKLNIFTEQQNNPHSLSNHRVALEDTAVYEMNPKQWVCVREETYLTDSQFAIISQRNPERSTSENCSNQLNFWLHKVLVILTVFRNFHQ